MSLKGNSASAGKRRAIAVNLFAAWLITFHANIMILHFSGIFSRKSLAAATPRALLWYLVNGIIHLAFCPKIWTYRAKIQATNSTLLYIHK